VPWGYWGTYTAKERVEHGIWFIKPSDFGGNR